MNLDVGSRSDVGRVREGNEDSYLVEEPLFVVADGMGGHLAGDVASQTAVTVISDMAKQEPPSRNGVLASYIKAANGAIYEKANSDPQLSGMGTTCTLLYLDGSTAHFAHVGDSRAYLFRDDQMSQITEDHTLVERMIREGRIQREEAASHPQRSVITRALGIDGDVEVDEVDIEVVDGDRIMLCSDGLSSMLEPETIARILRDGGSAQRTADVLVEEANTAGGEDNITVVVIDVGKRSGGRAAPPPVRQDTAPTYDDDYRPGRRWIKRSVIGIAVLGLILGGGYLALKTVLTNSYYVGLDEAGNIAIYQGRPEEVFGMTFRELERSTDISVDDLEEFRRDNLEEGIKTDSLEEAEEVVAGFERQVQEREEADRIERRQRNGGGGG
ncbi:MAG: Stp1/IreP family PP2C-type Ser/Thr phosphatase [Actinomycetota bacterium]